jgi:hypothetical protein
MDAKGAILAFLNMTSTCRRWCELDACRRLTLDLKYGLNYRTLHPPLPFYLVNIFRIPNGVFPAINEANLYATDTFLYQVPIQFACCMRRVWFTTEMKYLLRIPANDVCTLHQQLCISYPMQGT